MTIEEAKASIGAPVKISDNAFAGNAWNNDLLLGHIESVLIKMVCVKPTAQSYVYWRHYMVGSFVQGYANDLEFFTFNKNEIASLIKALDL